MVSIVVLVLKKLEILAGVGPDGVSPGSGWLVGGGGAPPYT